MARKPPKGKSLAEVNPELAKQWHSTKNGDLTPFDVTTGSDKKAWWKCDKGYDHEWQARIANRNKGTGCSVCDGRTIVKSNCLATLNPVLTKEWHPIKNGDLTPFDVSCSSNHKAWWKCDKGNDHEWKATIANRNKGIGCSVCDGKTVVKSNCLATLDPELTKQWHPTKNDALTPFEITIFSSKKIWWKCNKADDHEWESSVRNRKSGRDCPICSGRKTVLSNCLATLNPVLAKEWHPIKNGDLTPFDVVENSNTKAWWKCEKGDDHEWLISPNGRTGCPICSNYIVVESNSLMRTDPELAKQWHPTKNCNLTPFDFTAGSHTKVWWKCDKVDDHEWEAALVSRSGLHSTGCPECAEYGFNPAKASLFYIREVIISNKRAIKFGITNQMDGGREKKQKRNLNGEMNTILKIETKGVIALEIENRCKKIYGRDGYLSKKEMPDGFTETIKYSEENLNKIKSIVDEILTEKAEKKN